LCDESRPTQTFERHDAATIDADYDASVVTQYAKRRQQLLGIVAARCDAGEIRVAQQVVHAVRIEIRTAHEFAQHRIRRCRIADDEAE
jgi:hypothetical protein